MHHKNKKTMRFAVTTISIGYHATVTKKATSNLM